METFSVTKLTPKDLETCFTSDLLAKCHNPVTREGKEVAHLISLVTSSAKAGHFVGSGVNAALQMGSEGTPGVLHALIIAALYIGWTLAVQQMEKPQDKISGAAR